MWDKDLNWSSISFSDVGFNLILLGVLCGIASQTKDANVSWCLYSPPSKCWGSHSSKWLCCSLVFTCPSCWLAGLLWNQPERNRLPRSRKHPRSWSETSPSRPLSGKSGSSSGRKVLCGVCGVLWGGAAGIFIQVLSQIVNILWILCCLCGRKWGLWDHLCVLSLLCCDSILKNKWNFVKGKPSLLLPGQECFAHCPRPWSLLCSWFTGGIFLPAPVPRVLCWEVVNYK